MATVHLAPHDQVPDYRGTLLRTWRSCGSMVPVSATQRFENLPGAGSPAAWLRRDASAQEDTMGGG